MCCSFTIPCPLIIRRPATPLPRASSPRRALRLFCSVEKRRIDLTCCAPDPVADAPGPRHFNRERFERHAYTLAQARACCLDIGPGGSEVAGSEQFGEAQDG